MVRLFLLGGVRMELDGAETDLASLSRKARLLLAMLALEGRVHGRSELAGRLWPDVREASARVSLRTALTQLRAALHPAADLVLHVERDGGLALARDVWTDIGEVRRLLAAGDAEGALARSDAELLPGLDDDWVLEQRDDLRDRVVQGLVAAANAAEATGDLTTAVRLSRRTAVLDPLAETPQRELIRRLAAAGDRGAALTAYDRFRERLADELRIVPSAVTRGLVAEIRAESTQVAPPLPLPTVMPVGSRSPFVGRAAALDALLAEWERAQAGERRVVALGGDAGIGKTRLAAELCAVAHADGAVVLVGRCHEDALIPYEPFAEALRRYAEACPPQVLSDQVGPHRSVLAALVPELGGRGDDDEPAPARLVEAIVTLVREAARSRPAILLLEDMHWAEDATAVALRHLVRGTEDVPLLVVATYRGTELATGHPVSGALAEARRARVLAEQALDGLDEAAVGAIVAADGGGDARVELIAAVHDRTGGNPFFVEELVRETADLAAPATAALPRSVTDLLERRLRGMPTDALQVIEAAAVAGGDFSLDVLVRATGRPDVEVVEGLDAASRAAVVVPGPTAGSCSFAHALVRETVYAGLSDVRRTHLHGRVGAALESLAARPSTLAHHFTAAGDHVRALRHHIAAAREASGVEAFTTSIAHCDAALASARAAPPSPEVDALAAEAAFERGRVQLDAGRPGEAALLQEALDTARARGDEDLEIRTLVELGQSLRSSDAARAERALQDALALAERRGDVVGQARALSRRVLVHVDALQLDRAAEDAGRAIALARDVRDEGVVALALDALKLVWWQLGDSARLRDATRELEAIQRRRDERGRLCWTLLEAAQIPMAALQWSEAEKQLREVLALAERLDSWGAAALIFDSLATVEEARGDSDAALAVCDRALELSERAGLVTFVGWVEATAGLVLVRLRRGDAAVERLEHGLAMAERAGSRHEILRCAALLAHAHLITGDETRALQFARDAEAVCDSISTPPGYALLYVAPAIAAAAEVLAATGFADRGERLVRGPLAAAQGDERAWFAIPLAIAAARCLHALDEPEAAGRALSPALAAWRAGTFAPVGTLLRELPGGYASSQTTS